MLIRISLTLLGGALTWCWFATLYKRSYRNDLSIAVGDDALFIGLSVLLGTVLLAMVHVFRSRWDGRLATDYVTFSEALSKGALSEAGLAEAAGGTFQQTRTDSGGYETVKLLTDAQLRSLVQLVYEGRLVLRDGTYRLPD